jgi:hypothetical protein
MTTPTKVFWNITPCILVANYRRSSKMLFKSYQITRHHTIKDTIIKTDSRISFKMPSLNLIGCRIECTSLESIGQRGMNADLMKYTEAVIFSIMIGLNSNEDGGSKLLQKSITI